MNRYLAYFKTSLINTLEYRMRGLIWFIYDVSPPIIMLIFWLAAFENQPRIADYTSQSIVLYYFLVMGVRVLIFTYPDELINREINTGKIAFELVKPASYLATRLLRELSSKLIRMMFLIPLLGVLFIIFHDKISAWPPPELWQIIAFTLSCLLSIGLGYCLRAAVGLSTFWLTDIGWLLDLDWLAIVFLGGTLFPLDIFPQALAAVNRFLPFQYLVYFPTQIALHKISGLEMLASFSLQIFWLLFFYKIANLAFEKGRRAYTYFGG